jgi:uncharacterized paraquat-inducible protein A
MVSNWGFINKAKCYNYITLQGAFHMIRNPGTPIPSQYLSKIIILPEIKVATTSNTSITTITSNFLPEATQKISNSNIILDAPAADCFSCKEILSDDNWHRCHECVTCIHGKIICPLGADMHQDDDILYCINCSKSKK